MSDDSALQLREALPERDGEACAAIYAPYVADSPASFEERPPGAAEMAARIGAAHCWLLAEWEGVPAGFAYGSRHRERASYRWAADVSVYLDARFHRRGIGRALYRELFGRLRELGLCTLCAGITQPNAASNALHAGLGFEPVGTFRRIGWKEGAWHDVLWLQLDLRAPGEPPPPEGP